MPDTLVLLTPDALAALSEAVSAAVRSELAPLLREVEMLRARLDGRESRIDPERLYTPAEVATYLGRSRSTIYKIPHALLPRARGGRVRGADLVRYRDGGGVMRRVA